jgi:hypothetical protein
MARNDQPEATRYIERSAYAFWPVHTRRSFTRPLRLVSDEENCLAPTDQTSTLKPESGMWSGSG